MRRFPLFIAVTGIGLSIAAGCKKGDDAKPATGGSAAPATPADKPKDTAATDTPVATASNVGVEAGGIARAADEGPAASLTGISGTVEIRRVGEGEYAAAKLEDKLYPGDQVRTGEASSATVALADESVIEVAEVSSVGIGGRVGTADPASSAAVLSGLARFSVTPRTPGEGAFRVYTPQGVVITRGTTYGVGVAASGEARVGVEEGKVDVIGLAALDATPIVVEGGAQAVLDVDGKVAAASPWPTDDWGTWRDGLDVKLEAPAAIDVHATALANLDTQLVAGYADLDASATEVATFEASAAASADKADTVAYEASLPDGAATIDASFGVAGRLEALTWAYAGHATLANDIYVRHPAEVEAKWTILAPRVDAAILWPKRYEVTADAYLEPLRTQYYVHHPRGRAHAEIVGVAVPEFYAKVEPPALEPVKVRARVKTPIWIAPELTYRASARPVWVAAPAVGWNANIKVKAAAPRAKVAWYVRPPELKAKLLVGGDLKGKYVTKIKIAPPAPRASFKAAWKVPVGIRVKVGAPDLRAAANARAKIKLDAGGRFDLSTRGGIRTPVVRDHRVDPVGVHVKGGVKVQVPEIKGGIGGGIGVKVRDHRDGAVKLKGDLGGMKANIKGGIDTRVKVRAPEVKVKIKAPEVKVKVKAKGSIKF